MRQLLSFDRALRTGDFDKFRVREGIWEQIFSRFNFERERGTRRKSSYRQLLKEIRKSTKAMPDAAVVLDASNEMIIRNRAAKTLAGLKRHKDEGRRIDNILRGPKIVKLLHDPVSDGTVEIPSSVNDGNLLNCGWFPTAPVKNFCCCATLPSEFGTLNCAATSWRTHLMNCDPL